MKETLPEYPFRSVEFGPPPLLCRGKQSGRPPVKEVNKSNTVATATGRAVFTTCARRAASRITFGRSFFPTTMPLDFLHLRRYSL
jgi:hypothetical protein